MATGPAGWRFRERFLRTTAWLFVCAAGCQGGPGAAPPGGAAPPCVDTCEALGHECGTVCGQPCGECGAPDGRALSCLAGRCRCVPGCAAVSCGTDDGCGGRCPCPADLSCAECPLRLQRLDSRDDGRAVRHATLALESPIAVQSPEVTPGEAPPTLADLRIAADRPVTVEKLQIGPSLADSRKLLHRFTGTNLPWQITEDGQIRVLVLSGPRRTDIPPGRWLTLYLEISEGGDPGPVSFRLVRRAGAVAPPAADTLLQRTPYDAPLSVSPAR